MNARRLALPVLLLCAAPLLAGCTAQGTLVTASCGERLLPSDIPRGAPRSGGVGDAALRVRVLDKDNASIANTAVLAFWPDEQGRIAFVALRTGGDGLATVHAPSGAHVRVWGGDTDWTGDDVAVAGEPVRLRYPGADPGTLELLSNMADGFFDGYWVQTVPAIGLPVGPTHVWQPNGLPWASADRLALLQTLELRLEWRNNLNGILDLAIAVGRGDAWTQFNQGIQTAEGLNVEQVTLDRATLEANGWTKGDGLATGASLGPGGGFTTPFPLGKGQDWHMRWTGHFAQDPGLGDLCAAGGLAPHDVTSG